MSKFSKGDIVDVKWLADMTERGIVHLSWGAVVSDSGLPAVDVLLLDQGFIGHFNEDEVELALDEYEFMAVSIDQEDFEQTALGHWEWGTLEEAERLIQRERDTEDDPLFTEANMLQINRRRKAGYTVGHKAFRW